MCMSTCSRAYGFNHHALLPLPGSVSWRCGNGAKKSYQAMHILLGIKPILVSIVMPTLFDHVTAPLFLHVSTNHFKEHRFGLYWLTSNCFLLSLPNFPHYFLPSTCCISLFFYQALFLDFQCLELDFLHSSLWGDLQYWGTPILLPHPF